jgi:hypothetical protein
MTPDDLLISERLRALTLMSDQVQVIEAMADADQREADRRLARIARFAEVMDVGGDNLAVIENDVANLVNITSEQRNTIYSLTTALVGIVEAMRTVKTQRDELHRQLAAAPTAESLYEQFIALICAVNGCTREAAVRIAYLLTSSDEEVMHNDAVVGLENLARFRDAVFAAEHALDVEVY